MNIPPGKKPENLLAEVFQPLDSQVQGPYFL
jgi:hypothetical protein